MNIKLEKTQNADTLDTVANFREEIIEKYSDFAPLRQEFNQDSE